jgi:phage baseplate assembly protein W
MARVTRTFSDLDFNFFRHPKTDDVSVRTDEDAIKQSIRNLLLTKNFERPFRSFIGSPVYSLLFEPISPLTTAMIKKTIANTIENYEPRVDLLDVNVKYNAEQNNVIIDIIFRIKNTQTPVSVNVILERTR